MRVSVCIPTRNRPDELAACLESVRGSTLAAAEIIVSDDSSDGLSAALVAQKFPEVRYLEGPRAGLGPNRNNAIAAARGDWILFLDDDARLSPGFLACLQPIADAADGRTILTGIECGRQGPVFPNDQSFLGFQKLAYLPGRPVRTVVMNAALFPAALFSLLRFDDNLVYGYDEIDIASRALARGWRIELVEAAVNLHHSSPLNREFNAPHIEAARIYVTFRKYRHAQHQPFKAMMFLAASLVHSLAHHLRAGGPSGTMAAWRTHRAAWSTLRRAAT